MSKTPSHRKNAFVRHSLALLATGVLAMEISYLTLSPPKLSLGEGILSDKAYHFIAFAALVFPPALFYARSLIWVLPATLIFGGTIEIIQPFVGRGAEFADFIADAVGLSFGTALGLTLRVILRRCSATAYLPGRRG